MIWIPTSFPRIALSTRLPFQTDCIRTPVWLALTVVSVTETVPGVAKSIPTPFRRTCESAIAACP